MIRIRGHSQQRGRESWRLKVFVGRSADGNRRYVERTFGGSKETSRYEADRAVPLSRKDERSDDLDGEPRVLQQVGPTMVRFAELAPVGTDPVQQRLDSVAEFGVV